MSHQHDVPPQSDRRSVTAVITVLAISAFAAILNETTLNVALPAIIAEFHIPAVTAQWLTTGFLLTMAIVIPMTGFLIQRFTTRQLFVAALLLFMGGTALGIVAPSFAVLFLARVIQAAGTAIIMPLLMTTTLTLVEPERRGAVMGVNSVVISVAPALGPTVAGFIMSFASWRAVFGLLLLVGLAVFAAGLVFVKNSTQTRRVPIDLLSVLLSAVAFGGLVYGLSTVEHVFEGELLPVAALLVGVLGAVVFVRRQRRLMDGGHPLLDLSPFRVQSFRVAAGVLMVCFGTMLGTVVVLPILLQSGLGLPVLTTGLILLPGGLIQGVLAPFVGRVYDRVGARPLVIPGAALLLAGLLLLLTVDEGTSVALIVCFYLVFGMGLSLVMTPTMTAALGGLPRNLYGHGSAILNTLQQLAGAAGAALLVASLSMGARAAALGGASDTASVIAGSGRAFTAGAVVALIGLLLAFRVKSVREKHIAEPVA